MAINIASAFRLRNKMKERIKKLSDILYGASITKKTGTVENTSALDGRTFKETVEQMCLLMAALRDFNIAIDKANQVNREDLISLESLKAEMAFYDSITQKMRRAPDFYTEYNKEGGAVEIEAEFLLDQKTAISHLESLRKKKDDIEEKLGSSNYKTEVLFDINTIEKLL